MKNLVKVNEIPFRVIYVNKNGSTAAEKTNITFEQLCNMINEYNISIEEVNKNIDWCGMESHIYKEFNEDTNTYMYYQKIYYNLIYFSSKVLVNQDEIIKKDIRNYLKQYFNLPNNNEYNFIGNKMENAMLIVNEQTSDHLSGLNITTLIPGRIYQIEIDGWHRYYTWIFDIQKKCIADRRKKEYKELLQGIKISKKY